MLGKKNCKKMGVCFLTATLLQLLIQIFNLVFYFSNYRRVGYRLQLFGKLINLVLYGVGFSWHK